MMRPGGEHCRSCRRAISALLSHSTPESAVSSSLGRGDTLTLKAICECGTARGCGAAGRPGARYIGRCARRPRAPRRGPARDVESAHRLRLGLMTAGSDTYVAPGTAVRDGWSGVQPGAVCRARSRQRPSRPGRRLARLCRLASLRHRGARPVARCLQGAQRYAQQPHGVPLSEGTPREMGARLVGGWNDPIGSRARQRRAAFHGALLPLAGPGLKARTDTRPRPLPRLRRGGIRSLRSHAGQKRGGGGARTVASGLLPAPL